VCCCYDWGGGSVFGTITSLFLIESNYGVFNLFVMRKFLIYINGKWYVCEGIGKNPDIVYVFKFKKRWWIRNQKFLKTLPKKFRGYDL